MCSRHGIIQDDPTVAMTSCKISNNCNKHNKGNTKEKYIRSFTTTYNYIKEIKKKKKFSFTVTKQ